jgi:hypothetical protein
MRHTRNAGHPIAVTPPAPGHPRSTRAAGRRRPSMRQAGSLRVSSSGRPQLLGCLAALVVVSSLEGAHIQATWASQPVPSEGLEGLELPG